jgi:hypothetical protein
MQLMENHILDLDLYQQNNKLKKSNMKKSLNYLQSMAKLIYDRLLTAFKSDLTNKCNLVENGKFVKYNTVKSWWQKHINKNEWHHVHIVKDGLNTKTYIDGKLVNCS